MPHLSIGGVYCGLALVAVCRMDYLKRGSEEFNWGLGNRLFDNWEEAAMKERTR